MLKLLFELIVIGVTFAAGAKYGRNAELKVIAALADAYDADKKRVGKLSLALRTRIKKYL